MERFFLMNQKKQHDKEIQENELITWAEQKFGHLKPYTSHILLVGAVAFLLFVFGFWYFDFMKRDNARRWQDLHNAIAVADRIGDVSELTLFAQENPGQPASLWGWQLAGDFEMRTGIAQLPLDKQAGLDKVKKAKGFYEKVVESDMKKSVLLQRRSAYSLAYANETLGEFPEAKKNYELLLEEGEDSPYYDLATRALQRVDDSAYVAVYEKFREWQDMGETAPGPVLPRRPNISFPEVGTGATETGVGSNQFEGGEEHVANANSPNGDAD
jgi:hypothetical protein